MKFLLLFFSRFLYHASLHNVIAIAARDTITDEPEGFDEKNRTARGYGAMENAADSGELRANQIQDAVPGANVGEESDASREFVVDHDGVQHDWRADGGGNEETSAARTVSHTSQKGIKRISSTEDGKLPAGDGEDEGRVRMQEGGSVGQEGERGQKHSDLLNNGTIENTGRHRHYHQHLRNQEDEQRVLMRRADGDTTTDNNSDPPAHSHGLLAATLSATLSSLLQLWTGPESVEKSGGDNRRTLQKNAEEGNAHTRAGQPLLARAATGRYRVGW